MFRKDATAAANVSKFSQNIPNPFYVIDPIFCTRVRSRANYFSYFVKYLIR